MITLSNNTCTSLGSRWIYEVFALIMLAFEGNILIICLYRNCRELMLNTSNLHNIFWLFLIVWMYLLSASNQKHLLTLWTHMETFEWEFFRKVQLLNLQKPMYLFCKWESSLWQQKVACIKFQGCLLRVLKTWMNCHPSKK